MCFSWEQNLNSSNNTDVDLRICNWVGLHNLPIIFNWAFLLYFEYDNIHLKSSTNKRDWVNWHHEQWTHYNYISNNDVH